MANSGSPIHITPEQAISEVAALGEKIARGAELFSKLRDSEVAIATTPKDEVWRQDKVTLHHYRALADTKVATPVLIVYGLIGRYTMADLQEDRSLVRIFSTSVSISMSWIGATLLAPTGGSRSMITSMVI